MNIRPCEINDLLSIQNCNLLSLPENYQFKYYVYHLLTWPECSWVAEDGKNGIVGYVLAKLDDENPSNGHITSLAVIHDYRKIGIAEKLMNACQRSFLQVYKAKKLTLHVRKSNPGAIHLYRDKLMFKTSGDDEKYYADGEDAYAMYKDLNDAEFDLLK